MMHVSVGFWLHNKQIVGWKAPEHKAKGKGPWNQTSCLLGLESSNSCWPSCLFCKEEIIVLTWLSHREEFIYLKCLVKCLVFREHSILPLQHLWNSFFSLHCNFYSSCGGQHPWTGWQLVVWHEQVPALGECFHIRRLVLISQLMVWKLLYIHALCVSLLLRWTEGGEKEVSINW